MKSYAVVTGASSGIGAATAKLLAANGFHVIACARRIDRLTELAKSDSNIEIFELDVTNQRSVETLVAKLVGKPFPCWSTMQVALSMLRLSKIQIQKFGQRLMK